LGINHQRWLILALLGLVDLIVLALFGALVLPGWLSLRAKGTLLPSPTLVQTSLQDEIVNSPSPPLPSLSPTPFEPTDTSIPLSPSPTASSSITATCVITASGGLGSEIYDIVQGMPGPDSNGMVIPTDAQMATWETLVKAIADGDRVAACNLIQGNAFPYHLVHFTDVRDNNASYWILKEDAPVSVGWGTTVIRVGGVFTDVVVEVPHPVGDWRTDPEGVAIFRGLKARALLVAGAHRCTDSAYSPCGGSTVVCGKLEPYRASDVAHSPQTMFQAAHRALVPCGGMTVALQLHANSLAGCPDLFISNGTLLPGRLADRLSQHATMTCSAITVDIADGVQPECGFTGGSNVQGLYSNGCAASPPSEACSTGLTRPANPEQFIMLEQSTALRNDYACLVEALKETFNPFLPSNEPR